MTDYQARLDDEDTILTPYKVRQVEPSDLDIQPPSTQGTGRTPEELREELRETAKEAAKHATGDETNGAAVYTDQNSIYSGSRLELPGDQRTAHALRVAIYKALSEGASEVSDVVVYSSTTRRIQICDSCKELIEEFGTSGLNIRTIDNTGRERQYSFDEI
jgi:cytidine deaminase